MDFIKAIEKAFRMPEKMNLLPRQPSDVPQIYVNIDDLINDVGFKPETSIEGGIGKFLIGTEVSINNANPWCNLRIKQVMRFKMTELWHLSEHSAAIFTKKCEVAQ